VTRIVTIVKKAGSLFKNFMNVNVGILIKHRFGSK